MPRPRLVAGLAGLLLLLPNLAHAVDLHLRIEPAVAVPVTKPQSDLFNYGGGGDAKAGIGLGQYLDAEISTVIVALDAKNTGGGTRDPGTAYGFGGGLRLKLPSHRQAEVVSPFIDGDILYVRTGGLDRLGFTAGLGFHVPVGNSRAFWMGPFVRYFQIHGNSAPAGIDATDAKLIMAGLSFEVGTSHPIPPPDKDGDGIVDPNDRCPDQAGPLENGGCPDVDKDGDGLIDRLDKCPTQSGPRENNGCPDGDQDGDGVIDRLDRCPTVAGIKELDGCPDKDNDSDGVPNLQDKCPDQAGPRENAGCPDTDKDNDGVPDRLDRCPEQPGPADNNGCPKPKLITVTKEKIELHEKVHFGTDKATIFEDSYAMLNEVADALKQRPDVKVRIEGHTDSRGKLQHNTTLSQQRADAVRDYLVGKGVDTARMESKGFGPSVPVADNKTAKGREQNRRVEFVITSQDTTPTTIEEPQKP